MPFTSPDAAYLLKVNTNGNFLWCKKYGGGSNTTTGLGIQQTNDGGFVIAGQITDSGAQDVLLIKTDSSGISNCNEAPFVMSATNIGTNSSIAFTVGTGSSFTGSFPCYVNTVTTSSTTLCNNVGVTEQAESDKVTVYPNPSTGEFNIDLTAENALISIFDICGKPVVFKQVAPMKNSFSISQIGIYTVLVTSNKGVSTQRLIITR
jgi:hypothetical protein